MKKRVTLYYNASRHVWTHDPSGHSVCGWAEGEAVKNEPENTFEKVRAAAQKVICRFYKSMPGYQDLTPEDVEIVWAQAPQRFQPPPIEVSLTHFASPQPAQEPGDNTPKATYVAPSVKDRASVA